jgi:hypothetical protein
MNRQAEKKLFADRNKLVKSFKPKESEFMKDWYKLSSKEQNRVMARAFFGVKK